MRRSLLAGLCLALAMTATPLAQVQAETPAETIPLPDAALYPEGVAVDPATGLLYTVSSSTGVIFQVNADTGVATVVSDPLQGQPSTGASVSLGLKADGQGRLWVAGGRSGVMRVVEIATGRVLATLTPPPGAANINDVILTPDAAYFTDTVRPILWRVSRDAIRDGRPEAWLSFEGTPVPYGEGGNLNGIAATPDGRYLIVVHMRAGLLFRIDTRTLEVTAIDTGGAVLDSGDGLVLDGSRLYVVRQSAGEIVALDLSPDLATAVEIARIRPETLAWPATAALRNGRLIVANTQFNRRATADPVLPFSLTSIPLAAFD